MDIKITNEAEHVYSDAETSEIERMDLTEFLNKGYLQELNRRFLHPLGLALSVLMNSHGEAINFGDIWDYRDDPEGIYFDLENRSEESKSVFRTKRDFIDNEFKNRTEPRTEALGFFIEPIDKED